MQLFVLGPAFGLPSIDAECVATVALLRLREVQEWRLVATPDDRYRVPCLFDGGTSIHGFNNIARHVEAKDTSFQLHAKDRADAVAMNTFLQSHAQTLLDISLYVSFENYRHVTRPAFTAILPWNTNYILPLKLRAAAKARTEHLGISSIDVDNVHEDMSNRPDGFDRVGKPEQSFEVQAQKRASLLLPRKETVRSLLQRPEHAAVFKLHALAENFFGPLEDMLGDNAYLLGGEMNAVDCLAYGYLGLMLYPQVPQDWLAETMKRKYKKLVAYTERIRNKLDLHTKVEDVMSLTACKTEADVGLIRNSRGIVLPWCRPATSSIVDVLAMSGRELLARVPIVGNRTVVVRSNRTKPTLLRQYLPLVVGTTASAVTLSVYWAFRRGVLIWPHGQEVHIFGRKRLSDYGHLGAALAGVSMLSQSAGGDAASYQYA